MWLICAATDGELSTWNADVFPNCETLVSGVGIPETFANLLPKVLAGNYSRIINIGIAGAYPSSGLAIGDIVIADGEVYADLGMELPTAPGFLPLSETPWGLAYAEPYPTVAPPELVLPGVRVARGATVNACTGTDATGAARFARTGASFETMEGAAVAQIGQVCNIPVGEIRAISNFSAERDMRPENIVLAIKNLREYFAARARRS
ncbi:MAG: hypothetical protein H7Y38_17890 [Armatimonadetes bacterium]|nr:hypothetical protein [Armatimonadota bacterium]